MSIASDALVQAVAGLSGSIFSTLIVHPIDFVKMRMQVPGANYDGLLDAFRKIFAEEGFLQLYTGLGSELIKGSTQNFLYIYVYSFLKEIATELQTKRYERRWERQQSKKAQEAAFVLSRMQSDISKAKALEVESRDSSAQDSSDNNNGSNGNNSSNSNVVTPRAQRPAPTTLSVPPSNPSFQTPDSPSTSPRPSSSSDAADLIAAYSPTNPPFPGGHIERPAFHSMPLNVFTNILIGVIAGCVTQLVVNPLSVVQTRIMTQKKSSSTDIQLGIFGTAKKIVEEEGFSVLFTGLAPAFILTTNPAIQFLVFDRLKGIVLSLLSPESSSPSSIPRTPHRSASSSSHRPVVLPGPFSLLVGGIAKVTATLVTYPYIVAKLRLQWKGSGAQAEIKYRGALDVIVRIVKQDGFLGLYTGFGAQLFKSVLATSLLFFGKEKSMYYISLLIHKVQEDSINESEFEKEKKD